MSVTGLWILQSEMLFDICVMDTDTQLYSDQAFLGTMVKLTKLIEIFDCFIREYQSTVYTLLHFSSLIAGLVY